MHCGLSEFNGRRNPGFEMLSRGLCGATRTANWDFGGMSLLLDW